MIFFVTSVVSVSQEELRCSPRVQFHCWFRQPMPVVLLKRICFFHFQACIFTWLFFFIFTDHACLFICWNYFRPFVSSIIFSEINAGNMDIKSFIIIILPLNYLAGRLVMKKYYVIIDLMGFKGCIFLFWYTNTHVHVCTKIPVSSSKIEFCLKLDNHLLTY